MNTKAAFEKWAVRRYGEDAVQLDVDDDGEYTDVYDVSYVTDAWEIWQASSSAIEIDLPGQENYDDPLSAHLAIKDCEKAITSHGIRIKGKTS